MNTLARLAALSLAPAVVGLSAPGSAEACSPPMPSTHDAFQLSLSPDAEPARVVPVLDVEVDVLRGAPTESSLSDGCGGPCGGTGDTGTVIVTVTDATTGEAVEDIGFLVEVVDDAHPCTFETFDPAIDPAVNPIRTLWGGTLECQWKDGATEGQEAIGFTIRITPVNQTGEPGAPIEVEVADPGRSDGCTGGSGGSGSLPVVLALALLALRAGRSRVAAM